MAVSKYIQQVQKAAKGRPKSTEWYRDKIRELGTPTSLDPFPLVLPLERYTDGFLGINLHYLPINLRVRLLDRLVDLTNNNKFDSTTRVDADYARLKNLRLIRPTIKRYLKGRVKSQFRRIDADEFTIATLLPVAKFKKASVGTVWADSRKMI